MYRLLILLCSFVLLSCTEEPVFDGGERADLVEMTFSSDFAEQTKTSLAEGKKVYWTSGDRISVFDDVDFLNRPFMSSQIDGANAEFSGYTVAGAEQYIALYPYRSEATYVGGVLTTELPSDQSAVEGSFDTGLNIMAAKTSDTYLSFRNVCALLKVTVPEDILDVVSMTLTSSSPLCGEMEITFDEASQPVMVPADPASGKEIVLSAEGGAVMAPGDYYFVISPGEHRVALIIRTSGGDMYARTSSVTKEIKANQILNLGQIKCERAKHPCALVSASDIARVKASVATASG